MSRRVIPDIVVTLWARLDYKGQTWYSRYDIPIMNLLSGYVSLEWYLQDNAWTLLYELGLQNVSILSAPPYVLEELAKNLTHYIEIDRPLDRYTV